MPRSVPRPHCWVSDPAECVLASASAPASVGVPERTASPPGDGGVDESATCDGRSVETLPAQAAVKSHKVHAHPLIGDAGRGSVIAGPEASEQRVHGFGDVRTGSPLIRRVSRGHKGRRKRPMEPLLCPKPAELRIAPLRGSAWGTALRASGADVKNTRGHGPSRVSVRRTLWLDGDGEGVEQRVDKERSRGAIGHRTGMHRSQSRQRVQRL
jgi:hypothetical protein